MPSGVKAEIATYSPESRRKEIMRQQVSRMKTCKDLWPKAKGLLLPYEGMASQLYVLDLPLKSLEVVLGKLSDVISDPQVNTVNGETGDAIPLTGDARNMLLGLSNTTTYHVIKGEWAPSGQLSVWLWIDADDTTVDVEFVFWGDLLFPFPDNDAACIETFCECVALAEMIRDLNPVSECVLSASETGDPREDRDKSWTLFW